MVPAKAPLRGMDGSGLPLGVTIVQGEDRARAI